VTHSGDTADVQLLRPVLVTGAEGSKTVVDLPGDATNGLDVDVTRVTGNVTVVNAGTFATQPGGTVAHDAGDSGNPVKVGSRAVASLTGVTLVSGADRADVLAELDGAVFVRPDCGLADLLSERVTNTDGAATACTGAFAATASQRIYVTTIIIYNDITTNGFVDIRDGAAGSVLMTVPAPAKGGSVVNLPKPLRFTANTAVAFDASAAMTTLYLTFLGFRSKI
jgi:hypothetical protein